MFGLFSFVQEIVEQVIGTIIRQGNFVEEQVLNPITRMIQQITGGVWRGRGADAFVEEMNTVVLPEARGLVEALLSFNGSIRSAGSIIGDADEAIRGMIGGLADVFGSIF